MSGEVAVEVLTEHLTHWERLVSEGICVEDGRITVEALRYAIEVLGKIETPGKK